MSLSYQAADLSQLKALPHLPQVVVCCALNVKTSNYYYYYSNYLLILSVNTAWIALLRGESNLPI